MRPTASIVSPAQRTYASSISSTVAERRPAQRCVDAGRRGHLHEVADEQPGHASCGADGILSPPRSAASIASG